MLYQGQVLNVSEIKPLQAFMHALVTSNFDDDSVKNEQASIETSHSNYKYMEYFSGTQGQLTPQLVIGSGRNSNSSKILCMSLYLACFKSNSNREKVETLISRCSMAANSIISGPIWSKFELMQVIMYFHITIKFIDAQGQLTPYSVVRSGRIRVSK